MVTYDAKDTFSYGFQNIIDMMKRIKDRPMIDTILWDVDGTLLDFHAAEKAAIKSLFSEFELGECSDEMVNVYSKINDIFWQRLERNELSKPQVLVGRFEHWFEQIGVPISLAHEFNERYQLRLGDTIVYRDDSYQIVKSLRGRVRQYVVSNGTIIAQTKKLKLSGFGELMDDVFLSEQIGVEKPNQAFFDAVFAKTGISDLSKVMIVGDSLTSDIRGGNNAGILCCWYNPDHKQFPDDLRIEYVIGDLHEIYPLLEQ